MTNQKPVYTLQDAYIIGGIGGKLIGVRPEHVGSDNFTISSTIIGIDGDKVETRNSIYHVLDWHKDFQK